LFSWRIKNLCSIRDSTAESRKVFAGFLTLDRPSYLVLINCDRVGGSNEICISKLDFIGNRAATKVEPLKRGVVINKFHKRQF